jgi:DNA helicase-2/ATP-dependent DNA helicase PcrA
VNCLDLRLLQSIAAVNKAELTVVGDDDQAIYEWRGASPEFILKPDDYVGSAFETHILSRNYRSPRNIVHLSQKLIRHNKRRVDKEIIPHSKVDAKLEVLKMASLSDTIDWVVAEVKAMLANPEIGKVALIGRKRGQIIPYQIVFASHNIPFYAAEDLQVFLSAAFDEMKEILAIKARASAGPILGIDSAQDLLRLCDKVKRFPLSKSDRAALLRHLQMERPKTLFAAVQQLLTYTGPLKGNNPDGRISAAFSQAIIALLQADTVAGSIRALSNNFEGLQKDYGKSTEDIFYTDPPFLHLGEFAERYGNDYSAFYEDIDRAIATLARIPDDDDSEQQKSTPEWKLPLHLMTAQRAKGKEFDAVILLDVNKDIWPSKLAETPDQLEQERRVFYVAMTRAKKRLVMLVNDSMLGSPALPSQYLSEMDLAAQNH